MIEDQKIRDGDLAGLQCDADLMVAELTNVWTVEAVNGLYFRRVMLSDDCL